MRKHLIWLSQTLLIIMLAVTACSSPTAGAANHEDSTLPPEAAVRAREVLSTERGIPLDAITVVSSEQTVWLDNCLGLGGPAESCMRIDTPGWRVILSTNDETIEAHTDELGEQVRFVE